MQDSKFGEHLYLTPRVPQGLAAAVEGLTREVIRHRPENIYAFAARHFENLLQLREQYDDHAPPIIQNDRKITKRQLHEVNEAVRERLDDPKDTIDQARQSGWSLNETAKVLEKHRSIFGDSGQKVSTEQIRELANEPVIASRSQNGANTGRKNDRVNEDNLKCTTTPGTSRRQESSSRIKAPKILSQIPIAKDIKTELKRNRISSRERKKVIACEYTRETIIEKSSSTKKSSSSFEKTKKSYELRKSSKTTEDTTTTTKKSRSTETKSNSRANSQDDKKFSRGASMDSVKNYVMQNFVGMTSLDELQSPSYVEKVQEVIDETSSVIKEKVEALKSGVTRAAKAKKQTKKDSSSSSEEQSNREANLSRRNSKIALESLNKISLDQDVVSESSLPAVRPLSSKSTSRSLSARSDSDAALTLPPISPESAKSPKVKEELVLPVLSPPRSVTSLEDPVSADDTTAAVEDIAEDPTVSFEMIVEDNVEEIVTAEIIVKEDIVPSEPVVEITGDKEVVDEKKSDEKKVDAVVEKVVSSEEILVPPEDFDDKKSLPSEIIEDEKTASLKEIADEKTTTVDEKVQLSNDTVEEKTTIPEESTEEKAVPIEENTAGSVDTMEEKAQTTGDTVEEKIDATKDAVEQKEESSNERVEEKEELSKQTVEEKVDPPNETIDEKSDLPAETKEDKEITDITKPTIIEQTIEEKVSTTEIITTEIIDEIITTAQQNIITSRENHTIDLLNVKEEEFHDSLNVTPEPFDTKGQRPDSLENSLADDNASSGHISPIETLKDKLLEIEEVQKRIEDVLDDTTKVSSDDAIINAKIQDKLIEIQESEKRIERILNSQSTTETLNSDIKNKLQELEDAERRIESIFIEKPTNITEIKETIDVQKNQTNENLNLPSIDSEQQLKATLSRAVSPHSYILTEGSPYEIPDSITTVIIPERTPSPDTETLRDDDKISLQESQNKDAIMNDAFGEAIESSSQSSPSTVDIEYIRGIKASHDKIVTSRENLEGIKEEIIDSEDEKVLKVVTSSLEEILEKEQVEYVKIPVIVEKSIDDNSLESTTARSAEESTNEVKETSVTSDHTSLSLDQAVPNVPELNLDSLPDLTISSFNISSETTTTTTTSKREEEEEEEEGNNNSLNVVVEKQETKLQAHASSIVVTNNTMENNPSQCTDTTGLINTNESESVVIDREDDQEKKAYHIYVPEASNSKDLSTSTETSTFMSAATKIQAGVRGFLTRRRLQSTQKRSSTLDSVPSIQESFAVETTTPALMPIVETTSISELTKSRKKLRREDAVQRTTLSVENAFADNQLQHTGEFHDCIPLPVFDAEALSMKTIKQRQIEKTNETTSQVEQLLEKILLGHAAANFSSHPKLVDVVLLQSTGVTTASGSGESELQNKYLNFITSVEDVFSDLPETPKGVIIEEITTSLEDNTSSKSDVKKQQEGGGGGGEETLASISTSEDPLSINIEEVLGLGDEDDNKPNDRLNVKLNAVDQIRGSSNVSQDSPVSDERTRSPVTMMQIGGPNNDKSVDEKSEENPT